MIRTFELKNNEGKTDKTVTIYNKDRVWVDDVCLDQNEVRQLMKILLLNQMRK